MTVVVLRTLSSGTGGARFLGAVANCTLHWQGLVEVIQRLLPFPQNWQLGREVQNS